MVKRALLSLVIILMCTSLIWVICYIPHDTYEIKMKSSIIQPKKCECPTIEHPYLMKEINMIKYDKHCNKIRTILLYGPPGTGKTSFVKYVSYFWDIPIVNISMDQIENKYYGEALKLLRGSFKLAYQLKKCIIFFDELDGIATSRTDHEASHTLSLKTTLLQCIDELLEHDNVYFFCATNRPRSIDAAILRRMDIQVKFPKPSIDTLRTYLTEFEDIDDEEFESLFRGWTIHDMNKFKSFVNRHHNEQTPCSSELLKKYYTSYIEFYTACLQE